MLGLNVTQANISLGNAPVVSIIPNNLTVRALINLNVFANYYPVKDFEWYTI